MCDHENRESAMVSFELAPGDGVHTRGHCDPCLLPIIEALNRGGLRTTWSCCGHGRIPPEIGLADGRSIVIFDSTEQAQRVVNPLGVTINDPLPPESYSIPSIAEASGSYLVRNERKFSLKEEHNATLATGI